uniref:DUF1330 domain-containing protein n=1 Tax=uncultured Thermoplasmata archaeon TaxID=376542 RepID=A0A871XZE0_9ARCH|nr:hypothetical protein HULAa36F11_00008 [uncultured Thermoplasmata archaeon]
MEYDIPKDEEANARYLKHIFDDGHSCRVMDACAKLNAKLNVWSDGLGHIVMTIQFENMAQYVALFEDAEWRKGLYQTSRLVLNASTRLMRPAGENS